MSKRLIILWLLVIVSSCGRPKSHDDSEGFEKYDFKLKGIRPPALIIGDSISLGYLRFLQKEFLEYQVVHNKGNGRSSENGRKKINKWVSATDRWEVCTFNHGLWDIKTGTKVVPTAYAQNLRVIGKKLLQVCGTVLFVNTTHIPKGTKGRPQGKEVEYNLVAEEVMNSLGIPVCNVRELTLDLTLFKGPRDVHFSRRGYRRLANQIASCIRDVRP